MKTNFITCNFKTKINPKTNSDSSIKKFKNS